MENFNRLKDIITTFHIGIVYYEKQSYWVRHNPITHGLFYLDEINELIKKPLQDLSHVASGVAAKEIKNLLDLFAEIAKYKESAKNHRDALRQFEVNCTHYFVKVTREYSAIEHLKGSIEGAGSFVVTSYFLNDLDYEISVRAAIVDRLEIGLKQEINGIEPQNLSVYEPSKSVRTNYCGPVPGEIDWKTWAKILETDTHGSTDRMDVNTIEAKQVEAAHGTDANIAADNNAVTLFKKNIQAQSYIDILRKVTPPVIDLTGRYILGDRKKTVVVAFFDLLQKKGIINHIASPNKRAMLINEIIPGLEIGSRSMGNTYCKAAKNYENEFSALISKI